jgi:mycoredoxin
VTAQDKSYSQITMFGRPGCQDTARARAYMNDQQTPFVEVNIDENPEADAFVRFINHGERITPTIIVGEGHYKIVLTNPDNAELESVTRSVSRPGPGG